MVWRWLVLIAAMACGSKEQAANRDEVKAPATGAPRVAAVSRELPWKPSGENNASVVLSAYAFAGLDEKDLGRLFTSELKPIPDSNLFETVSSRKVARNAIEHVIVRLRDRLELEGGFNYLFAKVGATYDRTRVYELHRALEVTDVVRADDTPMRRPPDAATFFLAEVHRGASLDFLIEGEQAVMGAELQAQFVKAGGSAKYVRASDQYRMHVFGLGMRTTTGDGIFSQSFEDLSARYRTGEPVPVQLVFRTVPGRTYKAQVLPTPTVALNETVSLSEKKSKEWPLPPGRYNIDAKSEPNGIKLSWRGGVVQCDRELKTFEYRTAKLSCVVSEAAVLVVKNPSDLGLGPTETATVAVTKLP